MNTSRPPAAPPLWQLIVVGIAGFSVAAFAGYKVLWRKDPLSKADASAAVGRSASVTPPSSAQSSSPAPAPAVSPASSPPSSTSIPTPTPTPPKEYPLPPHIAGTRLDYRIHMQSARTGNQLTNETWVVAEVTSDRMKWVVNGEQTSESTLNPFVPMLETGKLAGREDISRTMSGDPMTIFPLAPGKSFRVTISGRNAAQQGSSYDYRCFVTGFFKAKSRVGELDVVEVKCTAAGQGMSYTARYLYAPSIGANIYYERKPAKPGGIAMVRELLAIQRPAK